VSSKPARRTVRHLVGAIGFGLVATSLTPLSPASAAPDGSQLVINEVYGGGGNSGATLTHDFIELYNPTDEPISLAGMSLQYRSGTGTTAPTAQNVFALEGTVPAKRTWLVQAAQGSGGTEALPTPDAVSTLALGGSAGQVFLAAQTEALNPGTGSLNPATNDALVDFVGFGATTYEGSATAPAASNTTSVARRVIGVDTDQNGADFVAGAPTPLPSTQVPAEPEPEPEPEPDPEPVDVTIAQIQGTAAEQGPDRSSPLVGKPVITRGVVTAVYPTGGYNGFYLQTPGTGTAAPAAGAASQAVFVYYPQTGGDGYPELGSYVEVAGEVGEFFGLTQVTVAAGDVRPLSQTVTAPRPLAAAYPTTDAARESLEGMLMAPTGSFVVADNYNLNRFGEIGLASGTALLRQPFDVGRPGSAAAAAAATDNAARGVKLDDGSSIDFLASAANKNIPLPYLSKTTPVTVGAPVTFTKPVILDYRNNSWKFQPTTRLTQFNKGTVQPATFGNVRTAAPRDVRGQVKLASFNVLNYFIETGVDYIADGGTCSSYDDRAGNPITVNTCNGRGPRGAWDDANLQRQQAKIVKAINALDADVVALEEIENSAHFAGPGRRDDALAALVAALNAAAGAGTWDYVRSPAPEDRPSLDQDDVIRNAFIYRPDAVATVGDSRILTGDAAFSNAREPLAQAFEPALAEDAEPVEGDEFLVVVNHFKSKSGGTGATGDNADTGQGAFNGDRVRQAEALVAFVEEMQADTGIEKAFLTGDFNAYTFEDPMVVLAEAGYTNLGATLTDKATYLFGGLVGSLDHMLANEAALPGVTAADIWNINAAEPLALEYSRFNYNATDFYEESPYRSSDHDPIIVGFDPSSVQLNLLNINDFHGRIDANTTAFATTLERLRAQYGDAASLFLSAGDNIGASLFASSIQQDQPTIDVLNALELAASAVGNHEFDTGFEDLVERVIPASDFPILGANVYEKGTTTPALQEYALIEVQGLTVGVIGAVTEETPSLVSPDGIEDLSFGDPVEAVNRVAAQLSDGDESNGEADVLIAEFHEGANAGTPDGSSIEEEVAAGGVFADIVEGTSADVDVIFTGHTHKEYAWDGPVPGDEERTRPIVQTGSYGERVGQVVLELDRATGEVRSYQARNVNRGTRVNTDYPRVAEVKRIVDAALAEAEVRGGVPVGEVTQDITTAFRAGDWTGPGGTYVGGSRDDRSSESTLGRLVADSLVDTLSAPSRGGAEIGIVNPGGLRNELYFAAGSGAQNGPGVVTYAEANAVLPFVNNLWTLTLTGAQFKQVLEQQFQTDASGASLGTFLHLGLSSNVSTTIDATAPAGERITSVRVDGEPLDPEREYRIGTFSFLAQGGDNFRAFRSGTGVQDTGLVDRDAWIAFLEEAGPITPTFDRRQVYAEGLPAEVVAGEDVAFTLRRLNLTSLGSPANTEVVAEVVDGETRTPIETFTVPAGQGDVEIAFTAPSTMPEGAVVELTANPSGTVVTLPTAAAPEEPGEPEATQVTATVTPQRVVVDDTRPVVTVEVTSGGEPVADGTVEVYDGTRRLGTATVSDGTAQVTLPAFTSVGRRSLIVTYGATDTAAAGATVVEVTVVKATPTIRTTVTPKKVVAGRTKPRLVVRVTAKGQTVTGPVAIRRGGKVVALQQLKNGQMAVRLGAFPKRGPKRFTVVYLGNDKVESGRTTVVIRVQPRR